MIALMLTIFVSLAGADTKDLSIYHSPRIEGRTLYIKGTIDSHIYDFFSYEEKRIREQVETIELNSLGGSAEMSLLIAQKIASLKKNTKLSKGSYCASACVVIFSAGAKREMDEDTWLGIHAARLDKSLYIRFMNHCFIKVDGDEQQFTPKQKNCQEMIDHGYNISVKMTHDTFDLMEQHGVSPGLRKAYFDKADDPAWPATANVVKKPDWILSKSEALKWSLVTQP